MALSEHLWLWLVIAGLTVVTFITRSFFLLTPARFEFSPSVQKALRYAPTIAIMAVIAPDILMHKGAVDITWHNPALLAAAVSGLVFVWRQSLLWGLVAGMAVFTLLRLYG